MVQEFNSVVTRQTYLQLAETLEGFLRRMRSVAEMLDVAEHQRIRPAAGQGGAGW